tara:strand:- start:71 stop:367 length:297 start_codon:yes stop_codon:yes gene_type:complete
MKSFKEQLQDIEERVKASNATRKKLSKKLDRQHAADLNLKVKNVIGDLDNLAWKLENQIDITGHENEVKSVTSQIDKIISDSKKLQNDLKKTTKALMK